MDGQILTIIVSFHGKALFSAVHIHIGIGQGVLVPAVVHLHHQPLARDGNGMGLFFIQRKAQRDLSRVLGKDGRAEQICKGISLYGCFAVIALPIHLVVLHGILEGLSGPDRRQLVAGIDAVSGLVGINAGSAPPVQEVVALVRVAWVSLHRWEGHRGVLGLQHGGQAAAHRRSGAAVEADGIDGLGLTAADHVPGLVLYIEIVSTGLRHLYGGRAILAVRTDKIRPAGVLRRGRGIPVRRQHPRFEILAVPRREGQRDKAKVCAIGPREGNHFRALIGHLGVNHGALQRPCQLRGKGGRAALCAVGVLLFPDASHCQAGVKRIRQPNQILKIVARIGRHSDLRALALQHDDGCGAAVDGRLPQSLCCGVVLGHRHLRRVQAALQIVRESALPIVREILAAGGNRADGKTIAVRPMCLGICPDSVRKIARGFRGLNDTRNRSLPPLAVHSEQLQLIFHCQPVFGDSHPSRRAGGSVRPARAGGNRQLQGGNGQLADAFGGIGNDFIVIRQRGRGQSVADDGIVLGRFLHIGDGAAGLHKAEALAVDKAFVSILRGQEFILRADVGIAVIDKRRVRRLDDDRPLGNGEFHRFRLVVLIVRHSGDGGIGLVLARVHRAVGAPCAAIALLRALACIVIGHPAVRGRVGQGRSVSLSIVRPRVDCDRCGRKRLLGDGEVQRSPAGVFLSGVGHRNAAGSGVDIVGIGNGIVRSLRQLRLAVLDHHDRLNGSTGVAICRSILQIGGQLGFFVHGQLAVLQRDGIVRRPEVRQGDGIGIHRVSLCVSAGDCLRSGEDARILPLREAVVNQLVCRNRRAVGYGAVLRPDGQRLRSDVHRGIHGITLSNHSPLGVLHGDLHPVAAGIRHILHCQLGRLVFDFLIFAAFIQLPPLVLQRAGDAANLRREGVRLAVILRCIRRDAQVVDALCLPPGGQRVAALYIVGRDLRHLVAFAVKPALKVVAGAGGYRQCIGVFPADAAHHIFADGGPIVVIVAEPDLRDAHRGLSCGRIAAAVLHVEVIFARIIRCKVKLAYIICRSTGRLPTGDTGGVCLRGEGIAGNAVIVAGLANQLTVVGSERSDHRGRSLTGFRADGQRGRTAVTGVQGHRRGKRRPIAEHDPPGVRRPACKGVALLGGNGNVGLVKPFYTGQ